MTWALAQIGGNQAEKVLLKYKNSANTEMALKALRVRKKNKGLSLMITENKLYQDASHISPVLGQVGEGEVVKVLKSGIVNNKEEGGRGGPAIFDFYRSAL